MDIDPYGNACALIEYSSLHEKQRWTSCNGGKADNSGRRPKQWLNRIIWAAKSKKC